MTRRHILSTAGFRKWMLAFVVLAGSVANVAQAAPITMSPEPVTLQGLRGDFTISLASGNTSNNELVFGVLGSDPAGRLPAMGLAAIVFDNVSVVSAGEVSDPDNLITGIAISGTSTVAGVLIDFGAPSSASFFVRLSGLPTTATIYSLDGMDSRNLTRSSLQSWISKTQVSFNTSASAVPEPGAALCFAVGLAVVSTRFRRP